MFPDYTFFCDYAERYDVTMLKSKKCFLSYYVIICILEICVTIRLFMYYVVFMWSLCGLYVVFMWSLCGLYVVFMWSLCGLYVVFMWSVCGLFVVCLWSVCGLFVVCLCCSLLLRHCPYVLLCVFLHDMKIESGFVFNVSFLM